MALLQHALELALQQEIRLVDAVAHLQVVLQRHLLDGTRVGPALGFERGEGMRQDRGCASRCSRQRHAILERAVHALAVERHHRVRGIAEQHGAAVDVPAIQVQRGQQPGRIALQVRFESGISGTASAKSRSNNARASAPVRTVAKLGSPSLGRNSVTVKVASSFGSAMHM